MRLSLVAAAYAAAMSTAVPAHAGGEGQVRADRSRSPRSSPGVVNLNWRRKAGGSGGIWLRCRIRRRTAPTHFVAEAEKFGRACSAKGAWHKEGYHHE